MEQPSDDQILASAVRFLIDGGNEDAARVLLSCSLIVDDCYVRELMEEKDSWPEKYHCFDVTLIGPVSHMIF